MQEINSECLVKNQQGEGQLISKETAKEWT